MHNELEKSVANFVGKPAAIVFGMGYVTNSAILPVLMGKVSVFFGSLMFFFLFQTPSSISICLICYRFNLQGGLIVSDSLNHNSIVNGARGSGASICVFQHNSKFSSYIILYSIFLKIDLGIKFYMADL